MVITAINRKRISVSRLFLTTGIATGIAAGMIAGANAGEWTIEPGISLKETVSDNINLTTSDRVDSYVNQIIPAIELSYASRRTNFQAEASNTFITYSHDHDDNDDYAIYQLDGDFSLWQQGPKLFFESTKEQVQQSISNNAIADLLTANAVSAEQINAGLSYDLNRSSIKMTSKAYFQTRTADDAIGDREGVLASFSAENGTAAKMFFWSSQLSYQDLESKNNNNNTKFYTIDAKLGLINSYNIMPFVRYYDEDNQGTFENNNSQNNFTSKSWGPGVRWKVSGHLWLDLSYNYVDDKKKNEDHLSSEITWLPSPRTSFQGQYTKRFYGDSFSLDFKHKTKRLTNTISYNENVDSFDRYNYVPVLLGNFYCPAPGPVNADCLLNPDTDLSGYILIPLVTLEPVEADQISLNKQLSWKSEFVLPRTKLTLTISSNNRENLTTKIIDDKYSGIISASRTLNSRSTLSYDFSYSNNIFDKDNLGGNGQTDHYRVHTINYDRTLNNSLSSEILMRYVDRSSSSQTLNYQEYRLELTLKKTF